ncbi:MAG: Crp/Fnr family transcriptional regulator [Flavobacteriales bacterium]|nr:Crp/Fnr family transcriptional regulator [Flavobacteriales bacterium]
MAAAETKLWYLEQVNILKGLNMEEMQRVAERTRMSGAIKDQQIFFADQPSNAIYFLKQGRVKIATTSAEGKEIVKAVLFPGEVFGELAIAGEEKRHDRAVALDDDVIVCSMDLADAQLMLSRDPRLHMAFTRLIGQRMIGLERRLENLVFKDSRSRIIALLRDMATEHGRLVGTDVLLDHSLTHQDIADLTATARQTVTTVLSELQKQDLVHMERGRLLFRDLARLN